jgi:hypothetical protein
MARTDNTTTYFKSLRTMGLLPPHERGVSLNRREREERDRVPGRRPPTSPRRPVSEIEKSRTTDTP